MSLTIAAIETDIGSLFHQAGAAFAKIESAVHSVVVDVDAAAPIITAVVSAINPGAGAATSIAITALNAVDAAIQAAGTQTTSGVTVNLPAQLVADWTSARAAILAAAKVL